MSLSKLKFLDTGPQKGQFKTFKVPLKSICKEEFLPKIEEVVIKLNELVIHSYQFIRLFILYCYNNNFDFEITEEFIRQSISILGDTKIRGICKNKELHEKIKWFYLNQYQPLVNHIKPDISNMTHFTASIATQLYTMYSNNALQRFESHFRRFVNETVPGTNKEKNDFKFTLLSNDHSSRLDINPIYYTWYNEHMKNILQGLPNKSIYYDLKVRPLFYLKGMLYMNTILEGLDKKLFQPLPLRSSIIPMNIMFTTTAITRYFTECQPKDILKSEIKVSKNTEFAWSQILHLDRKVFKSTNYSFYYMMNTDGISCSLTFIRKDLIWKKQDKRDTPAEELHFPKIEQMRDQDLVYMRENCNIIGCDPGKRNLVYMVNDQKKHLTYTNPQRQHESKSKRNKIILERWKKKEKINQLEERISECNSKTMNYIKFQEYLREKVLLNQNTKDFYQHKTHRTMKLRTFIYGKKSIDNFINKIGKTFDDGRRIVIAYGDWSETTQMKNSAPSLGKGLRKLIHRKYFTFSVNEMYTSKRCNKCFEDLENFKDKKSKKVHRLLVCSTCVSSENKKVTYRSRDINAGINIMNVAKHYMRYKIHYGMFDHIRVI